MTTAKQIDEWKSRALAMFDAGGTVAETVVPLGLPRTLVARVKDRLARVDKEGPTWANAATARGEVERLFQQAQRAVLQPDVVIEPRPDGGYLFRGMNRPAERALRRELFDWYEPGPTEDGAEVVTAQSLAGCREAVLKAGFTILEIP